MSNPRLAVVLVAAGTGERLGFARPKALVPVGDSTILGRAVAALTEVSEPVLAAVVVGNDWLSEAEGIVAEALAGAGAYVRVVVVPGGATRQDSVSNGLAALTAHKAAGDLDLVLVHDAARVLTPASVFERVAAAVRASGDGVVPVLPVTDTIKRVSGGVAGNRAGETVGETVDRSELRAAQTPQGFPFRALVEVYAAANSADPQTDDAALAASHGLRVRTVDGDELARKITTKSDLDWAVHEVAHTSAPANHRVGTGVDAHAFRADGTGTLRLALLEWPDEPALEGHSDGDAAAHALVDALLAAASLGDIGTVFGTSNEEFRGASGDVFLTETIRMLAEAGWTLVNATVEVVGNRPKLAGRRAEAEKQLGALLGCPVSLSATTTDGLGLTGEGKGIGAIATVLIRAV